MRILNMHYHIEHEGSARQKVCEIADTAIFQPDAEQIIEKIASWSEDEYSRLVAGVVSNGRDIIACAIEQIVDEQFRLDAGEITEADQVSFSVLWE